MSDKPKRRIIVEKPKESDKPTRTHQAEVIPVNLSHLVEDAMHIIGNELSKYRAKTDKGITLDLKEARVVQSHMDCLIKMMRESREAAEEYRKKELEGLSTEELLELASKELKDE